MQTHASVPNNAGDRRALQMPRNHDGGWSGAIDPVENKSKSRDLYLTWMEQAALANFNVQRLAKQQGMCVRQMERLFRVHFGLSPKDLIERHRIALAARLLMQGLDIKAIWTMLAFHDAAHFSRAFRKHYGVAPSHYTEAP